MQCIDILHTCHKKLTRIDRRMLHVAGCGRTDMAAIRPSSLCRTQFPSSPRHTHAEGMALSRRHGQKQQTACVISAMSSFQPCRHVPNAPPTNPDPLHKQLHPAIPAQAITWHTVMGCATSTCALLLHDWASQACTACTPVTCRLPSNTTTACLPAHFSPCRQCPGTKA